MPYYTKEEINKARDMDLKTYLELYDPDELIYCSKNTYMTREHDSLRISNGMWYWFSRSIGGKSALDYLIKVKNYTFLEAVEKILKISPIYTYNNRNLIYTPKVNKTKLILPPKNNNNNKVISYLKQRGIDEEIINYCISNNLIYETLYNHNVVFIGLDDNNIPKYAGIRGTNKTRYIHDASGSDKTYSFRLETTNYTDTIHIFESAIDLLSYATLEKENNRLWNKDTLISLAGVYQPSSKLEESKIPLAIKNYLDKNKNIKNIYIHFDNDKTGRNATVALQAILSNNYKVINNPPPYGKDFNDFLCATKKLNYKNNIEKDRC